MNRRRHQSARVDGDQPQRVTDPEAASSAASAASEIGTIIGARRIVRTPRSVPGRTAGTCAAAAVTHVVRGLRSPDQRTTAAVSPIVEAR